MRKGKKLFRKVISLMLMLMMVITAMVPSWGGAAEVYGDTATEVAVSGNVIDITDYVVASYSNNRYQNKVTNITVSGADVVSSTENGTTVNVVLDESTPLDAAVNFTFGKSTALSSTMTQSVSSVSLVDGKASVQVTINSSYAGSILKGSVTYTINFTGPKPPENPPECIVGTDTASTYQNTAVSLDLKDYFKAAKTYYLVKDGVLTELDGSNYSFRSSDAGTYELEFAAGNDNGMCEEHAVVTVTVKELDGIYIGAEKANGSLDFVQIRDGNGNAIDGMTASFNEETKTIEVILPGSYDPSGKVKAVFTLTQNSDGYPFLTTSSSTAGTATAWGKRSKEFTATLSSGAGTSTVYYYNAKPNNWRDNVYDTYTITYKVQNGLPVLTGGAEADAEIFVDETFRLDLDSIFTDPDGDALSYKVSVNGAEPVAADADYQYSNEIGGEYTLVFSATDGKDAADVKYTVNLTVKNLETTYPVVFRIPSDIDPAFYITKGSDGNGNDTAGDVLTAEAGETVDGFTYYTVQVPDNIKRVSFRGTSEEGSVNWGGMSVATSAGMSAVTVRQMMGVITTKPDGNTPAEGQAEFQVKDPEGNYAVSGGSAVDEDGYRYNRFLVVAGGNDFIYTHYAQAKGGLADTYTANEGGLKIVEADSADVHIAVMPLKLKKALTFVVLDGAEVRVFTQNNYYKCTELQAIQVDSNGDGTKTWMFNGSGQKLSYRVSMEGEITKAGYVAYNTGVIKVDWEDDNRGPNYRSLYDTSKENGQRGDDGIVLNVNGQNNLKMSPGSTFTLKAYRIWQIIDNDTNNLIIEPDFNYKILSGNDVVSVTPITAGTGNGGGNWATITAKSEGVAVIEVSYDAIEVANAYNETAAFNATDPARKAIVVVQVGDAAADVDFGIKRGGTTAAWDTEFDTLYFIGEQGCLEMNPTAASGSISEVAVSSDNGGSWKTLTAEDGTYNVPVSSGSNIIRVTKADGTQAYQVVYGDKITVSLSDEDGDKIIEAGEAVTIRFNGVHSPAGKMSGVYNPGAMGYGINTNYTFNGAAVTQWAPQYRYQWNAALTVTVPADAEAEQVFDLTNGCISYNSYGYSMGGHRTIPEAGLSMGTATESFHTRSVLPDLQLTVGASIEDVTIPLESVSLDKTDITIEAGCGTNLTATVTPLDATGYELTWTSSDETVATVDGGYVMAKAEGTAEITVKAGEKTAVCTVTVVPPVEEEESELVFDIPEDEIAGYVTISFEDNGVRDESESIDNIYKEPLGTIVETVNVPYKKYDNLADVTLRLLDAKGITYTYTGSINSNFYLSSIGKFTANGNYYESFGEFDAGSSSGWMITRNGEFLNQGASEFLAADGDVVEWKYTCQLGADIGDSRVESRVAQVEALIDAIVKPVGPDSIASIAAARAAYDELDKYAKKQVSNYDDLLRAEAQLNATEADRAAAEHVEGLIDDIGTVTLESEPAIVLARSGYDSLTDLQKLLVENYDELTAAEAKLQRLQDEAAEDIYKKTGDRLESLGTPGVGSVGGDWIVIGLERSGRDVSEDYFGNVVEFVRENIDEKGRLHNSKSTEASRIILALTAMGIDPQDVDGYNLLEGLTDMGYLKKQGINGPIWALIAFDSHDYEIPEGGDVSREALIDEILAAQLADGGWALGGNVSDVDMTSMAIQALAPYYDSDEEVKTAVDTALALLSARQNSDGTFSSDGEANAESCAQVIVALTALGIDPASAPEFTKNDLSALDGLLSFAVNGESFAHVRGGDADGMATEQGYYAMAAYYRFVNGQNSLFDMTDVELSGAEAPAEDEEILPEDEKAEGQTETDPEENGENSSVQQGSGEVAPLPEGVTNTLTKSVTITLDGDAEDSETSDVNGDGQSNPTISDMMENPVPVWPWIVLAAASAVMLVYMVYRRRKEQ